MVSIVSYNINICIVRIKWRTQNWWDHYFYVYDMQTENTAVVQGIMCEPSSEHLIPRTCAVFPIPHENEHRLYFLTRLSKTFNGTKKCRLQSTDMTDRHDRQQHSPYTCYRTYSMYTSWLYTCSTTECGIGWYRYTSHSENHCAKCENT